MEYKTPMVAEKLGVSPKVVMRIVQHLQLDLQKNKFGHYVFTDEDVQQILNYSNSPNELQTTDKMERETVSQKDIAITQKDIDSLHNLIQMLEHRISRTEEQMQEKADNVVNYQLLHHRNEIEELQRHIRALENQITSIETCTTYVREGKDIQIEKPKRRRMSLSFFGQ